MEQISPLPNPLPPRGEGILSSPPFMGGAGGGPAPRVSIIIVNWNGRHHLAECLDSLAAQSYRDFEVVLVDNGSNDGSVPFVEAGYPAVKIVPLVENTGFAQGNNLGFAVAQGEYLVTLNNDTRTEPGWLAALVAAADADPRIGMVASRIGSYADPDCLDSIGVAICLDGMSRAAYRQRRFSTLNLSGVIDILLPSACAALYRRTMLDEIGDFDEDFFAYCEDTDFGLRGRSAGWRAVAALDAVVLHKYSQTGGAISPFKLRMVERNHYWVAIKNFTWLEILLLPVWTAVRLVYQGRAFCSGSWQRQPGAKGGGGWPLLMAMLVGWGEALVGVPRMLMARRRMGPKQRITRAALRKLRRDYRLSFGELLAG